MNKRTYVVYIESDTAVVEERDEEGFGFAEMQLSEELNKLIRTEINKFYTENEPV